MIRPVNILFIQEEMMSWWLRRQLTSRTCNTAKVCFLTEDDYLRDTFLKVRRRQIWYRTMKVVKREPVMTFVTQMLKDVYKYKMPSNLSSWSSICRLDCRSDSPCPCFSKTLSLVYLLMTRRVKVTNVVIVPTSE